MRTPGKGQELGYHPLGMLPDDAFEAFRESPSTLEEGPVCTSLRIKDFFPLLLNDLHLHRKVFGGVNLGSCPKMKHAPAGGPRIQK